MVLALLTSVLKNKWIYWLPIAALFVYALISSWYFPLHDFGNYYFGAKLMALDLFVPHSYYPCFFNEQIVQLGHPSFFGNFNPNPPFLLLVFYPLTFLEPATAKLLFNTCSTLFFVFSLYRLSRHLRAPNHAIALIPFLIFIPIWNNILFGQVYLLLCALLIEGYLSYLKKKYVSTSLCWSLAILIKVFPILLFLFLLAKREYKLIGYLLIAVGVGLGFTILALGMDLSFFYFTNVLPASSRGTLTEAFVLNYQSFDMWLKYVFLENYAYNPNPPLGNAVLLYHLFLALFYSTVVYVLYNYIRSTESERTFGVLLFGMLLLTPYGNTYSLILLSVVILVFAKGRVNIAQLYLLLLIFLIAQFNYQWLDNVPKWLQFPRLFSMLLLFVFLTAHKSAIKMNAVSIVAFLLVFTLKFELPNQRGHPSNLTMHYAIDPRAIICDYELNHNKVTLYGWNRKEERKWVEPLDVNSKYIEHSAKNRGLGYYTLFVKDK